MLATRRSTALLRPRATTALAPATPRRLASSTTEQVKQSAQRNRNTILGSAGALLAIYGVTVYFSGGQSSEKRRKAIQRIDRSKAAATTPSIVSEKASEAKAKSPSLDSSSSSTPDSDDDAASDDHSQEAAFNPETGEINWDCPCLGGMAHGTCGEHFKTAFSCFVFSEAEPKGMDCVDKFQAMQACFRENPKEYEQVIDDTADLEAEVDAEPGNASHDRLRTAESQGRGKGGGPGPVESIKQSATDLAGAATSAYEGAKDLATGDGKTEAEVKQSKTKQRGKDGGPLRQPGSGGDDGHKSKASSAAASNPHSGSDEKAQFMADGHGSSDKFEGTGVGRGKDSLDAEKTTNVTKGERDPLGRNAATGSKPSGSAKAHEKHKEGVEKTRSGEELQSSKEKLINRG